MLNKEYKTKVYKLDEINLLQKNNEKKLIEQSEQEYKKQIEDIVNDINKDPKIKIVLVTGPSSAGKTTTSKLLTENFNKKGKTALVVSLDDFFINRDKTPKLPDGNYDYENIKSLDIECFNNFLNDLIKNNYALMPVYDFISGKRKQEYIPVTIDKKTIVIIEGIHALNPILVNIDKKFVRKIYISTNSIYIYGNNEEILPKETRLMRRMIRDFYTRGHSISATIAMWNNVLDGEKNFIDPYKDLADYKINSTHMYEPLVLASCLAPLIIKSDNEIINKLTSFINECNKIDKNKVPKTSLLQEFLPLD